MFPIKMKWLDHYTVYVYAIDYAKEEALFWNPKIKEWSKVSLVNLRPIIKDTDLLVE